MNDQGTSPRYIVDKTFGQNDLLMRVLTEVVAIPDVKQMLDHAYELHGKPVEFTSASPSKDTITAQAGAFYDPHTHRVHILPERFSSNSEVFATRQGDQKYTAISLQHALIHEIGHAKQNLNNLAEMEKEFDGRINAALADSSNVDRHLADIMPLQQRIFTENQRIEAENVPVIDVIIGKYYGEPPREEYANAYRRKSEIVDGCLVHEGPIKTASAPAISDAHKSDTAEISRIRYDCAVSPGETLSSMPNTIHSGSSNEILFRK